MKINQITNYLFVSLRSSWLVLLDFSNVSCYNEAIYVLPKIPSSIYCQRSIAIF